MHYITSNKPKTRLFALNFCCKPANAIAKIGVFGFAVAAISGFNRTSTLQSP